MRKAGAVPDAWDDDWESQADKEEKLPVPPKTEEVKTSKAERLAQHAETNKKLWQSAEEPETFHFLAAKDNVPLKTEFKPALKLLSRKPTPKVVKRIDPVTGLEKLVLDDDEDDGSQNKIQLSPEELRLEAQRALEEKQKKYAEVRARIMGSTSGTSTPGATTPPTMDEARSSSRTKNRSRGGGQQENRRTGVNKELFDPNYTPKPGSGTQNRNADDHEPGRTTPREQEQILRNPRGPDGSGRGGFGFVRRGGKPS